MINVNSIIVDDEDLARVNIREALKDYPNWNIQAELNNANTLYEIIKKLRPDVVFLDIKMPGKKGIDVVKKLLHLDLCPHIIFITAFDDYAIQAFELYAVDYLLKPFNNKRFELAINRAEEIIENERISDSLKHWQKKHFNTANKLDKIIIRSIGSIKFITIQEVYWFGSSGNYVEVHHHGGVHLHRVQLVFLESQLDMKDFLRIHRSAIVKISEVKEFKILEDNRYRVLLSNGDTVKVSLRYKDNLLKRLGID